MSDAQTPFQRIGDAERDRAVALLQEHHVAGRIDRDEFGTRMTAALTARTENDLAPLFADLPRTVASPVPTPVLARPLTLRPTRGFAPELAAVIWPLTIWACLVTQSWYLMAIPFILSMALGHGQSRCGPRRA